MTPREGGQTSRSTELTGRMEIHLAAILLTSVVRLSPGVIAHAEIPPTSPQRLSPQPRPRGPEPDGVSSAAVALRAAFAVWPMRAATLLEKDGPSRTPDPATRNDSELCDVATDPCQFEWTISMVASAITVGGLIVAAMVIGLLRTTLVFAWSWRSRRISVSWG